MKTNTDEPSDVTEPITTDQVISNKEVQSQFLEWVHQQRNLDPEFSKAVDKHFFGLF